MKPEKQSGTIAIIDEKLSELNALVEKSQITEFTYFPREISKLENTRLNLSSTLALLGNMIVRTHHIARECARLLQEIERLTPPQTASVKRWVVVDGQLRAVNLAEAARLEGLSEAEYLLSEEQEFAEGDDTPV